MKDEDFPNLYSASDVGSLQAQKTHLYLQKSYLASLVIGSLLSLVISHLNGLQKTVFITINAILLTFGLFLLWVTKYRNDEKMWFDCRAIAESVKTTTWRFMMRGKPFESDISVDERFISQLKEIREARPKCNEIIARHLDAKPAAITNFMREERGQSLENRKLFYLKNRLVDQKNWYSKKAKYNANKSNEWFWILFFLQVTIIIIAFVNVSQGGGGTALIPVFTTLAAVVSTWNQIKRHNDLSQSYSMASQELQELEAVASNIFNEQDFSQFVEQVEEAVSREHTMWCARRDVLLA